MVLLREIHQVNPFGLFFSPQLSLIPFIGIMESGYCAVNGEFSVADLVYKSMTVLAIEDYYFLNRP